MAFGLQRFCCFLDDLACEIFIYARLPAVILDDLRSFYDIVGAQGGIRVREPRLNGGYNLFGGQAIVMTALTNWRQNGHLKFLRISAANGQPKHVVRRASYVLRGEGAVSFSDAHMIPLKPYNIPATAISSDGRDSVVDATEKG